LTTFYLKYIPGKIATNNLFFCFSDAIGFAAAGLGVKYLRLGRGIRLGNFIAAVGGILYLLCHGDMRVIPTVICMARAGSTMSGNINYIAIPRLFPVRYVATLYGITNFVAHLFACFAPLVAEIKEPYPFIIYLVLIAVSTIASSALTELDVAEKDDV
jgi:hypothetical protein